MRTRRPVNPMFPALVALEDADLPADVAALAREIADRTHLGVCFDTRYGEVYFYRGDPAIGIWKYEARRRDGSFYLGHNLPRVETVVELLQSRLLDFSEKERIRRRAEWLAAKEEEARWAAWMDARRPAARDRLAFVDRRRRGVGTFYAIPAIRR